MRPLTPRGRRKAAKGTHRCRQSKPVVWAAGKTKVLVIGGGSSHDFGKFFGGTDVATLTAAGFSVNYTEDRDQAAAEIGNADVAVISVNRQFFDTPAYRKALADFAASGKGLVMLHPGTWYGYAQWPELNATIVGGGARGHDRIAKFSVNAVKPDHPVMKGVPASFEVEDELYYMNAEPDKIPAGTAPIEVLAETSPSVRFKQPHPSVWITQHSTARIVGIALGHDERVHDLQPFKTLLDQRGDVGGSQVAGRAWSASPRPQLLRAGLLTRDIGREAGRSSISLGYGTGNLAEGCGGDDLAVISLCIAGDRALQFLEPVQHDGDVGDGLLRCSRLDHEKSPVRGHVVPASPGVGGLVMPLEQQRAALRPPASTRS